MPHSQRHSQCLRLLLVIGSICAISLTASPSRAQGENATGAIDGTVFNATNELPVAKARVVIAGTTREMLTNDDGSFFFESVPAGEVTLSVSYLGFLPQTATITVAAGKTATRDFQIRREGPSPRPPGATGEEIVLMERFTIVADQAMSAQAIAMNEQRHAASIAHILALEELPGQGYENIGDYLRFLPGVSITDDGESAGYLSLGGFPSHMSTVSLDGGSLASTGINSPELSGGRELTLQDVPMMNIERVEITKVPTPDRPASGLGGSMNLVSKGLLGTKRSRLDYTLTMNLATNDNFSLSGEVPQASIPHISTAHKQPSFSLRAVVPASKNLVFSAGFSKTWKQLPAGMLTETALWNLWDGVRFTNDVVLWGDSGWPVRYVGDTAPYDPNAPAGTYPGVLKGDYPIAMNTGYWQYRARLTHTEDVQAGVEMRLSRRDTLALGFRRRNVSEASSGISWMAVYGSHSNSNPAYDVSVPSIVSGGNIMVSGDPATTTGNTAATGHFGQGEGVVLSYNTETTTDHLTLLYKHRGPKWNIDGNASWSHGSSLRSSLGHGYTAGTPGLSYADGVGRFYMVGTGINTTKSILPTRTVATMSNGTPVVPFDAENLAIYLIRMGEYGRYVTDKYEGRLDFGRVFSRHFSLKFGGAWNREERDQKRESPSWRMLTRSTGHPLASVVSDDPRLAYHYDVIDESIKMTIGGVPVNVLSPVKIWNLTQDFPEYFQHYSAAPTEPYSQRANNSKLLREDISAGYLRADIRLFQNRLHAVLGARYERTHVDGWSGIIDENAVWVRDENGNRVWDEAKGGYLTYPAGEELYWRQYQVRALHLARSYDGLYPSVNLNYAITPNLVARAAYARTIGRPNVGDIVSGVTRPNVDSAYNAPTEDEESIDIYRMTICNPGLKPWTADSFHLSFDSYHFKGGFGSIGVYRKYVTNFFVARVAYATADDLREVGITEPDIATFLEEGSLVEVRRTDNVGDADLTGVEFTYRQDLFFLPSWLQKTQVWFNYTHIKVSGPNAEDFIGFTPDTFSAGINYIRPRFSLRLSVAYQGETSLRRSSRTTTSNRYAHLVPPDTFEYQAPRTRWGLTAEYSISRAFILFANCNDLFANDVIIYRRAADTPDYAQKYQRRAVASYVSIGVKGTF